MATFVLVHGAWRGGWYWQRVTRLLRGEGHEVYLPTLTGLGERSHLLHSRIDLSTHIQDVINVIRWEELSGVVLCGHSYGGMVITGVADALADRITSLVYVDAFVPEAGDAAWDFMPEPVRQVNLSGASSLGGYLVPPPPPEFFNVNPADRPWVDKLSVPTPLPVFLEKIQLTGDWKRIPKRTFILATGREINLFRQFYERLQGDPAWTLKTAPCGHDVMLAMPEDMARMLVEAAP